MLIAVVSDIHFDLSWKDPLKRLAGRLKDQEPDLLILAGDIGEPLDKFIRGLRVFQRVCERRAAFAGNHDVWHRSSSFTSQELWETRLEEAAREQGYHWLERENLTIGSLGVCGSLAWYDYSGKHPHFRLTDEHYESLKPLISNDGNFIDWPWTDREFARRIAAQVCDRLDALSGDPQVADILVATHVPLFDGLQRSVADPEAVIADAYYAHLTLGERIKQYEKVRVVVSGHVHVGLEREIPREGSTPLKVYTNPADYGDPAALLLETETWQVTTLFSG